jgi:hypothetical protein
MSAGSERPNKRIILIFGPGRSGTSLAAQTLGQFGISLGANLKPGDHWNLGGYFEDREILELHKTLLDELGCVGSYGAALPLPDGWLDSDEAIRTKAKLTAYVKEWLAAESDIAIKDPRISALLPMWDDIARALDADLDFILCVRSPAASASSFSRANKVADGIGETVWLSRVMAAAQTWKKGYVLHYEDMIKDYEGAAKALGAYLLPGRTLPAIEPLANTELDNNPDPAPIRNDFVREIYEHLPRGAANELVSTDRLAAYRSSMHMLDGLSNGARGLLQAARQRTIAEQKQKKVEDAFDRRMKRFEDVLERRMGRFERHWQEEKKTLLELKASSNRLVSEVRELQRPLLVRLWRKARRRWAGDAPKK